MTLPVPTTDALAMLNLPSDLAGNPIFAAHAPLVLASLSTALDPATYTLLTDPDPGDFPSADLAAAAPLAYAFLLLASTAEFLNLKTVGQGIIKVVGLDSASTALLSGSEIEDLKRRLTGRALEPLRAWLSTDGLAALAAAQATGPSGFRIALI